MSRQAEFRLHCFVSDLLEFGCRDDVVYYHVPNGERRSIATARRLKRMSVLPGVADFEFHPQHQPTCFLELKSPTGRLSPAQVSFRDRITVAGRRYAVARTGQEAISILSSWGILERVKVAA